MKIRKFRLVLACANLLSGICRLAAALVNMAFNYRPYAPEVAGQVRAEAR